MIVLTTPANEKSVYWITVGFLDEDNIEMSPDVAAWTLTDLMGNLINAREDVSINAPEIDETVIIVELSGDDLAVDGNDIVQRIVTLEGTYTSLNYGAGKPFNFQIQFPIEPVIIV